MSNRSRALGVVASLLLSPVAGCGPGPVEPRQPPTQLVKVEPEALRLRVGESNQLTVTLDPALAGASITWSSDAPGVARISSTGMVIAATAGAAVVTATAGAASGKATVIVVGAGCRLFGPC